MALTTYSELQTSIAGFLNRDDLTAQIPDFITMAEASINRDVRHWRMETREDSTYSQRYEALPTDWVSTRVVSVSGDTQLDLLSQAKMLELRQQGGNSGGEPRYYSISTSQIELYPTPDGDYDSSMVYYARVPALTDSETSNWLLADSPDVYLYGALIHSAPYLQEDARAGIWAGLYQSAVQRLNSTSNEDLYSGSGLAIR